MKRKEAYALYHFARKATLLADTYRNALNAVRYLTRTRKEKGVTGYQISVCPTESGHHRNYRQGITLKVPAGMAYPKIAELMRFVRDESRKQLEAINAPK